MKRIIILTTLFACFLVGSISAQWNPKPNWKDSYKANGFCWCDTNFDHNLGSKKLTINNTAYGIKDVCDELKKFHPQYRPFNNGDEPYNDIQCGNGPVNDAPDEAGCPGRVDLGPAGCNMIGPKFDMNWLSSRSRFGGDNGGGGDNNGPNTSFATPSNNATYEAPATISVDVKATDGDGVSNVKLYINNSFIRQENVSPYLWNNGNQDTKLKNLAVGSYTLKAEATDNKGNKTTKSITINVTQDGNGGGTDGAVTIKGQSINKYVSSEGGSRSMRANRNAAGSAEKFTVQSSGNGTVSFKGNNGKYVSSENGNKPMNCNRNAVGSWEKFTLESLGGDLYAIKGNNGKYVSHENGNNNGINCNRNAVGQWEKFVIPGLNGREFDLEKDGAQNINLYPNPAYSTADINLDIDLQKDALTTVQIMDISGKVIAQKNLGVLKTGSTSITLNEFKNSFNTAGLYLIKINLDGSVITKRMMVK